MVGTQQDVSTCARPEWSPAIDDPAAGTWYLAGTRINMERRAAQDFLARSIDYFLPLVDRVQFSGGVRRVTQSPAFSRYIFVRGNEFTPAEALASRKLMNVLPIVDQDQFRQELAAVELAIDMNPRVQCCPYAIRGNRCRIASGPLAGKEGIVLERKERSSSVMITLQVTALGQGIELEIDAALLEPAD